MTKIRKLMLLALVCALSGCFSASIALPGGGGVTVGQLDEAGVGNRELSYGS
jgi:hypothetical protein